MHLKRYEGLVYRHQLQAIDVPRKGCDPEQRFRDVFVTTAFRPEY